MAAKDGGGVDDAVERVTTLAAEKPDFVTILVGANDACASQASQMMSTTEFREKFATLLEELTATSPETVVLAMSIPDFKHVWELGKENPTAIRLWSEFYGCRNLLRDPTSTAPEAERSRQAVFQRVIDFNGIIEEECETFDRCMTDNNDLFRHKFTVDEISDIDFFHPSAEGQRTIAEIAWKALTREVIL